MREEEKEDEEGEKGKEEACLGFYLSVSLCLSELTLSLSKR